MAGLTAQDLPITAPAAILMDAESGAVLYARDSDRARPPASTTKILTAILLAENCNPSDIIVADKEASSTKESSMHLKVGEKVSARQLMHAIMMRSANDACVAVAIHISGSVPKFAEKMNAKAKELGCKNYNFVNPNGLPDPKHLVSAHDLAILGRKAMEYPSIREVSIKQKHELTRSINQKDRLIENRNKLLAMDPTVDGVKTGWTRAAGNCFVGSATRDEKKFITVVMNSEDWKQDTLRLLDWGTSNFTKDVILDPTVTVASTNIAGGSAPLNAVPKEKYSRLIELETQLHKQIIWRESLQLPIEAGSEVGDIVLTDGTGWTHTAKLYARESVTNSPTAPATSAGVIAIGLGLVGAYSALRYRRNQIYGRISNTV